MDYGIKGGKSLSLGMPREGIPSFVFVHWQLYLELYFYSPHDMCFAWSVMYYISLCLLVYHNYPFCTHLLREAYLIRICQNTRCASLISFELDSFCSSASLISFGAWQWLNFEEIASLSCFTYIILRFLQNSMVFSMVIIWSQNGEHPSWV